MLCNFVLVWCQLRGAAVRRGPGAAHDPARRALRRLPLHGRDVHGGQPAVRPPAAVPHLEARELPQVQVRQGMVLHSVVAFRALHSLPFFSLTSA